MMRPMWIARLLITALAVLAGTTAFAQDQAYRVLETPQATSGEGVEVREFFSYGCPHCHDFEPRLAQWTDVMGDRVTVIHTPVTFGRDSWELLARAYYAAEALGILDNTHQALFEAIHIDGRQFQERSDISAFYASVADVSEADVMDALGAFSVEASLSRAERLVSAFGVPGTPALGIDGRYLIDVRAAGGQTGMLDVAESLVAEEAATR